MRNVINLITVRTGFGFFNCDSVEPLISGNGVMYDFVLERLLSCFSWGGKWYLVYIFPQKSSLLLEIEEIFCASGSLILEYVNCDLQPDYFPCVNIKV